MNISVLKVDGMSCEHCVKAINKAVSAILGVENVSVDLKGKTVTVEHEPTRASLDRIKNEIEDQGYEVFN